ncbi:ribosomal RNA-processing protein 8 [Candida albicans P34048]|nr:ribosomal RNA-processing protein 8 [Candida albicans P34048]
MVLFEVKGWDLKNNNKIKVGGLPEKKNKNKNKNKNKREPKQIDNGSNITNNETNAKPSKSDKDNSNPKKDKKRKHENEEQQPAEDQHKSSNKQSKKQKKINRTDSNEVKNQSSDQSLTNSFISSNKKLTPLQQKMMAKLSGSRFRWINEQLYTISSEEALKLVKDTPSLFDEYHQGFNQQVASWPENPVDVFVDQIKTRGKNRPVNAPGGLPGLQNKQVVIADMGCGEAQLSLDVTNFVNNYNKPQKKNKKYFKGLDIKVHSFDLKKQNDRITVADIKNVPLPDESCSIVIFCLSLMGTNFLDFIKEAWRILIPRGEIWIAEIKSRFSESGEIRNQNEELIGEEFVNSLKAFGLFHKSTDNSNKMFTRFEFFKPPPDILRERQLKLEKKKKKFIEDDDDRTDIEKLESKRSEKAEGEWLLKPCIYKRR